MCRGTSGYKDDLSIEKLKSGLAVLVDVIHVELPYVKRVTRFVICSHGQDYNIYAGGGYLVSYPVRNYYSMTSRTCKRDHRYVHLGLGTRLWVQS